MWRKAKQRAEAEQQELEEANMIQVKGRGKKRAAERKANMERGLNEARGFTPGLLRLRDPLHQPHKGQRAARSGNSSAKRDVRKKVAASHVRKNKAR
jgi:hypothetical protein